MVSYKGRGALGNPEGRYLQHRTETVDDGWYHQELPESIATQVRPEPARTIITRNDSPDIPFEQSINPYRGCEHGCIYCAAGDTPILMANGTTRPMADIRAGDLIYGTTRKGWYRRYVKTRVLAHWSVVKPAYRIELQDGTVIVAGGDHRFLTERGWKFVTGVQQGEARRPHLTTGNKLMGTGAFATTPQKDADYQRGYLCGLIRGDGFLGHHSHLREGGLTWHHYHFRLALCDQEALARAQEYLQQAEVATQRFAFCAASVNRRAMHAIGTQSRRKVEHVWRLVAWPVAADRSWYAGFLAGIFDAEGSYSGGAVRISNTNAQIIGWIGKSLQALGFRFCIEHIHRTVTKPIDVVRVLGGLSEHLRFFHSIDPAILRKRDISGQAVKSAAQLGVTSIEPLGGAMRLTTSPPAPRISSPTAWSATTATPARATPTWTSRPASTSRPRSSSSAMRRSCSRPSSARPGYRAQADHDRRQHRPLPAGGAGAARDALAARGARAHAPSADADYQEHADPARPGPAHARWRREQLVQCVRQHHQPRC